MTSKTLQANPGLDMAARTAPRRRAALWERLADSLRLLLLTMDWLRQGA